MICISTDPWSQSNPCRRFGRVVGMPLRIRHDHLRNDHLQRIHDPTPSRPILQHAYLFAVDPRRYVVYLPGLPPSLILRDKVPCISRERRLFFEELWNSCVDRAVAFANLANIITFQIHGVRQAPSRIPPAIRLIFIDCPSPSSRDLSPPSRPGTAPSSNSPVN